MTSPLPINDLWPLNEAANKGGGMGEDYNQLIGAGREKDIKSGLGLTERWQKHSLIVVRWLSLSRGGGGDKEKAILLPQLFSRHAFSTMCDL